MTFFVEQKIMATAISNSSNSKLGALLSKKAFVQYTDYTKYTKPFIAKKNIYLKTNHTIYVNLLSYKLQHTKIALSSGALGRIHFKVTKLTNYKPFIKGQKLHLQ